MSEVERILISAAPGETRVAMLADDALEGLVVDRSGQRSLIGDIYLGRVDGVLDGLQAAFIDIGAARAGFLALPDIHRTDDGEAGISDLLSEGDSILVQVTRDPQEDKGAKLTTRLSISGRDLVLAPDRPGVMLSRRITAAEDRERLQTLVEGLAQDNEGYVLREAAAEAEDEDLQEEVERLRERWRTIEEKADASHPPKRLYGDPPPVLVAVRDNAGAALKEVVVDDPGALNELRQYAETELPDVARLIKSHNARHPLFDGEGVEELIDAVLEPWVPLPSGGSLIISETPALTAIDVNTGGATRESKDRNIMRTNEEAATEVARQIRLRNLSGLLVIDFVPVRDADKQEALLQRLRRALSPDPLQPNVVGFSRAGLVEVTRRRRGASLSEIFIGPYAPPVKSALSLAFEALRAALREAAAAPGRELVIVCGGEIADAFKTDAAAALAEAGERLAGQIGIETASDLSPRAYSVKRS